MGDINCSSDMKITTPSVTEQIYFTKKLIIKIKPKNFTDIKGL